MPAPANEIDAASRRDFLPARYCRWLSEQDGIPEHEMVYWLVDAIGPEMKLPKNWLARTGYRLPLHREFELANRGPVRQQVSSPGPAASFYQTTPGT